jgi:osmotically-inducible protein OsmY
MGKEKNGGVYRKRNNKTQQQKGESTMKMKAMYRVALMVAAVALLAISMPVYASKMDDRIESSAKKSYVFKTYLKGDDIKIQSKDGAVTLTGVVSEQSRRGLAKETVAGLPGGQKRGQQAGGQRCVPHPKLGCVAR